MTYKIKLDSGRVGNIIGKGENASISTFFFASYVLGRKKFEPFVKEFYSLSA